MHVAPGTQFLDQQTGHDRLTGPGVVGEQKTEGLPHDHFLIHGGDLMRQRIDEGRMDCQMWVEQMSKVNTPAFCGELEEGGVRVKWPCLAGVLYRQGRFVVTVDELGTRPAGVVAIRHVDHVRADPVGGQNGHLAVGDQTPESGTGRK